LRSILIGLPAALLLASASASAQSVLKGVYSEAQAARGEKLYAENCDRCHLSDMQGAEFMSPAIGGRAFGVKWDGKTLDDTFAYIVANMPQDKPGGLNAQTYADIIAYILKFSRYPAGTTELPGDPKALAGIKVERLP
jgi:S-disulfanyl-L-cysteine oxidoreductase SoxD